MPCRHPALALDLDLPLGFEGELIFQASVDRVAELDAPGTPWLSMRLAVFTVLPRS
jgi:hypothetical protein